MAASKCANNRTYEKLLEELWAQIQFWNNEKSSLSVMIVCTVVQNFEALHKLTAAYIV